MSGFSSLQYFCAVSPIDIVIDAFINEEGKKMLSTSDNHGAWSIQSQSHFAALMASQSETTASNEKEMDWSTVQFLPSERYVRKLVMRYVTWLELQGREVEDDDLASLICFLSKSPISNLPDPTSHCNARYDVPLATSSRYQQNEDELKLTIRIYPQHNDVGVAKVWEAGAALAEFIIHNPTIVKERDVVELGAGVGLTGLVAAAFGTKSVHMTDYTESTLENLSHNVTANEKWLRNRGVDPSTVNVVSII
jgi:hypothetical protein